MAAEEFQGSDATVCVHLRGPIARSVESSTLPVNSTLAMEITVWCSVLCFQRNMRHKDEALNVANAVFPSSAVSDHLNVHIWDPQSVHIQSGTKQKNMLEKNDLLF